MPTEKTLQMLSYVIKNHPGVSITGLMKLSYIIDLVSIQRGLGKISDFEYMRYNYGPFDKKIYHFIEILESRKIIGEGAGVSSVGDEFVTYHINDGDGDPSFSDLTDEDRGVIDDVLSNLEGYGPKALTELTYKTKPMKRIGAQLGNQKGLNQPLDLRAE